MPSNPSEVTHLYIGPAAFAQPTIIPEAHVAMMLLRFYRIRFEGTSSLGATPKKALRRELSQVSDTLASPSWTGSFKSEARKLIQDNFEAAPSPEWWMPIMWSEDTVSVGLERIQESIARSPLSRTHSVTRASLRFTTDQHALADAIISLIRLKLFPTIEYIIFSDPENRSLLLESTFLSLSWSQRVLRFFGKDPLACAAKARLLEQTYGFVSIDSAIANLTHTLETLERLMRLADTLGTGSKEKSPPMFRSGSSELSLAPHFLFGAKEPALVDAFLFSGLSLALFSRFSPKSSATYFQSTVMAESSNGNMISDQFPRLLRYSTTIATHYFEQYVGIHFLGIPPPIYEEVESNPYQPGRTVFILTSVFLALGYGFLVNIPVILAILEAQISENENEDHEEDEYNDESQD